MPKSAWSATGEAGARDLRGAYAAAVRTLCYQKKKKIIHDPKKQRPVSVSCALSLGVEGGDAGEKGEPV